MALQDVLDDRQAESRAATSPGPCRIHPVKPLCQMAKMLRTDALARIRDG